MIEIKEIEEKEFLLKKDTSLPNDDTISSAGTIPGMLEAVLVKIKPDSSKQRRHDSENPSAFKINPRLLQKPRTAVGRRKYRNALPKSFVIHSSKMHIHSST